MALAERWGSIVTSGVALSPAVPRGHENWIGISGAQEVEGRRFFAMVGGSIGLV